MANDKQKEKTDKPSTANASVTGEELKKRCIKYTIMGLIKYHWEGGNGWDNICQSGGSGSSGAYPSMGFYGWEGTGGGAGDQLLDAIGLPQYKNMSYPQLVANGGVEIIKQKLDSDEGRQAQVKMGSESLSGYMTKLEKAGWKYETDGGLPTIYYMCWSGTNSDVLAGRLIERNGVNIALDATYQWYKNNWMLAAGEQYLDEYNRRNDETYQWCKSIDMNKDPDPNMIISLTPMNPGDGLGFGEVGYGFKITPAGGKSVTITKLPIGKTTPCEPIYPDLITISDTIPAWILDATIVEINKKAEEEYQNSGTLNNNMEQLDISEATK